MILRSAQHLRISLKIISSPLWPGGGGNIGESQRKDGSSFKVVQHFRSPLNYEPGSLSVRCWWPAWSAWPPALDSLWFDDRDHRKMCSPALLWDVQKKKNVKKKKKRTQAKRGWEMFICVYNDSPPMSSMVSSPFCSTWRTGGTFCLASTSRALRSISTDSSVRGGDATSNHSFKIKV